MIGDTNSVTLPLGYRVGYGNTSFTQNAQAWNQFSFTGISSSGTPSDVATVTASKITFKKKAIVVASLRMFGAGTFGVALVMNNSRRQSSVNNTSNAMVTIAGVVTNNDSLWWEVYGNFQSPQNYNSACGCDVIIIPIQ